MRGCFCTLVHTQQKAFEGEASHKYSSAGRRQGPAQKEACSKLPGHTLKVCPPHRALLARCRRHMGARNLAALCQCLN